MPADALAGLRRTAAEWRSTSTKRKGNAAFIVPELRLCTEAVPIQYFPPYHQPPIALADDGSFSVEHVPPGVWLLQLASATSDGSGMQSMGITVGRATLIDGETTTVNIDLAPFRSGVIEGQAMNNGEPIASAWVVPIPIMDATGNDPRNGWMSVKTDGEGRFRCGRLRGPYRLGWLNDQESRGHEGLRCAETVTVEPDGNSTQVFHFHTSTLRVRVLDASGAPARGIPIHLRDAAGEPRHVLTATDAEGRTEMLVEAETFTCKTLPVDLLDPKAQEPWWRAHPGNPDALASALLTLGSVTVQQGATTEVELRLPAGYRR
jgi:hypothetical protein